MSIPFTSRRVLFTSRLVLAVFLLSSFFALAQEATIVGTVSDPSGSVLPNVEIRITNVATGQVRSIATNEAGQYVAPGLPIGQYTVKAQVAGFAAAERVGIVLNVNDRERVDFSLKVGSTQESVTVEANSIAVQTDSGEVSGLITNQQMTQLETNGRSLYSLINLTPGAVSLQADFQVPTPMGGDQNVSFNGQRFAHNLFMIDGAEAADRGGSGSIVMPSIDAVAEMRQLTSNYGAEYGMSSAATVASAIRSGSKAFHGTGWWFGRNDFLNSRRFTQPRQNANGTLNKVQKMRFNLWGYNASGPVDFWSSQPKTFFFFNQEWRRLILGGSLNTNVPLPATYGGNLSSAFTGFGANILTAGTDTSGIIHTPFTCRVSTATATAFTNAGLTLSPCVGGNPDYANAVAFPNNTIPTALLNANAQALLAAGIFPAPTTGRQFVGGADSPTNVREEIVRIDHTFNSKFAVFGHWIQEKQLLQTDIPTRWSGGANLPTVGDTFGNPSYSGVVHFTHTISPTLLNEAAFNYGGNRINIVPLGIYSISRQASGFQQNKLFSANASDIIPIINLNTGGGKTGSRYDANWSPWSNIADSYQVRDDLSWSKGAHQLKFGGSWLNFRKLQPLQVATQGNFGFSGQFTNYDFADYLLGLANSYNEAVLKDDRHWNSVTWSAYVQDNWRVNTRLTLNLGLRWDGIPHTAEIKGQMSNFVPSLYDPTQAPVFANANFTQICSGAGVPNATCLAASPGLRTGPNPALNGLLQYANGLAIIGEHGVPKGLVKDHWANFGPRIGFAYDATADGKTIVRGGFGMFFERVQGNDMYQAGANNLFGGNAGLGAVSLSDPHIGVDQSNASISSATVPVTVNNLSYLVPDKYRPPTSYQYSLGVQRQLGAKTVASIAYVGNQNRYLSNRREINLPSYALIANGTITNSNNLYRNSVPYLGYQSINANLNEANSHYQSIQTEFRSQLKYLSLNAAYTWSRSIDPTTGTGGNGYDLNNVSNPWQGWKYDIGPSFFDRTHVAFVNFIYDLPVFRSSSNRLAKAALGGWQLSSIITMQSGAPLNLGVSGNTICRFVQNCAVRPDQVGAIAYPKNRTTFASSGNATVQWFLPQAFAPATSTGQPDYVFGNAAKNVLRGPGRFNTNMALFKKFAFTERASVELRAEAYNVWNHTQWRADQTGGINLNIGGGADVGKLSTVFDPRVFQLGGKIIF